MADVAIASITALHRKSLTQIPQIRRFPADRREQNRLTRLRIDTSIIKGGSYYKGVSQITQMPSGWISFRMASV